MIGLDLYFTKIDVGEYGVGLSFVRPNMRVTTKDGTWKIVEQEIDINLGLNSFCKRYKHQAI